MDYQPRKLSDPADLKALAHPLRMALLEHLSLHGAQTATQLAAAVGDSPSNCSWHLRKLAEHGYVEEVAGTPGRSRPWRSAGTGLSWDTGEEDDETGAAARELTEVLLDREIQRLRASREAVGREPEEWRRAQTFTQGVTWLTAEEADGLSRQLEELLLSHGERRDPALRPPGSRLVSLVGWLALRPEEPRPDGKRTPGVPDVTSVPGVTDEGAGR